MREILFRGKSPITQKWVYGDLFQHGEQRFIMADNRNTEVLPETVGQYTGLTDKNAAKIFEGDIVQEMYDRGFVRFGEYVDCAGTSHVGFFIQWLTAVKRPDILFWIRHREIEVIENIYGKPKFLESAVKMANNNENELELTLQLESEDKNV